MNYFYYSCFSSTGCSVGVGFVSGFLLPNFLARIIKTTAPTNKEIPRIGLNTNQEIAITTSEIAKPTKNEISPVAPFTMFLKIGTYDDKAVNGPNSDLIPDIIIIVPINLNNHLNILFPFSI